MKVWEFNKLTLGEKQQILNEKGEHKALAAGNGYNYLLYTVGDFFVETSYYQVLNEIVRIEAFTEGQVDFDKYIDMENRLTGLFKK